MKTQWHVNQKVWDKTISKKSGKIESFNNPVEKYPIIVNFSGFKQSYTIDGKLALDVLVPTLSTKPYEIKMEGFSQEVEEELPKKGQIVWVRDFDGDNWCITHFIEKSKYGFLCNFKNDSNNPVKWDILTIKNPYEDSDVSILENTDREPQIGDMVYAWSDEGEPPTYGELIKLSNDKACINPLSSHLETYKHCSLKNPLVK